MMTVELTRDQEEKLLEASLCSCVEHLKNYPIKSYAVGFVFPDKGDFKVEVKVNSSNDLVMECLVDIKGYRFKASKEFGESVLAIVNKQKKEDEKLYNEMALEALSSLL